MSDDEALERIERRIDCPLEWCHGAWLEHGGDGSDPDQWVHEAHAGIELGHGAALYRTREGAGPDQWSFIWGGQSIAWGHEPARLARMLREVADAVEKACVTGT